MDTTREKSANGASRVLVAMSGGVDSSVAALVLQRQGYDCEGVTLELLGQVQGTQDCPSPVEAARAAAERLCLPFRGLDCSREFADQVAGPFCDAYLRGLTPNPCIECNRHLKFGALHRYRHQQGFDFLATGHYARIRRNGATGRYELLRGANPRKDQSYFLYHLSQGQLAHTLLPLGELAKDEVRALAQEAGLPCATAAESQDICFIPDGDYVGFIRRHAGTAGEPGPILDAQGNLLGTHQGLAAYTIGQRKGLGIAYKEPLFVLAKDIARNGLVVGTESQQGATTLWARNPNLIAAAALDEPLEVQAKASYRQQPQRARARLVRAGEVPIPALFPMDPGQELLQVTFDEPLRACACGQALVAYDGDAVIAGGTICAYA